MKQLFFAAHEDYHQPNLSTKYHRQPNFIIHSGIYPINTQLYMALIYYRLAHNNHHPKGRGYRVPFPPAMFGSGAPRLFATSFTISEDAPLGSVNSLPCRGELWIPQAKVVIYPGGFVSFRIFWAGFFRMGGMALKGWEFIINHHLFVTTRLRQSAT